MFQKLKNKMKDQRGLTLIELLAVIVILAIIAAIAIPSIMGLIDNSKKDAHVANAQQMINSAKMAITADRSLQPLPSQKIVINLEYLEEKGYLEEIKDPDGARNTYKRASASAATASAAPTTNTDSYVIITNTNNTLSYEVELYSTKSSRGVRASGGGPVGEDLLNRDNVR
ncbi:prepilin-type N-terminal cleavage/methylation domain-containing protein [Neobacillus niacini]|uniref:prepilin-type N-terminal cleavage/methylation domain-containing protein n=1 Tax=Neobacillus niacini TaxID=86668 RepID=UPI003983143C